MAATSRRADADVAPASSEEALEQSPEAFTFYQAMRILERTRQEGELVGRFSALRDEAVRLSVNPSLAFPAGDVQELIPPSGERRAPKLRVNFMGLVGNQGVLPTQYMLAALRELDSGPPPGLPAAADAAAERTQDEGSLGPLTDFLDLFQHRMLSLLYRAWERSRPYVAFERDGEDPITDHLYDLMGLGPDPLRGQLPERARHLLSYTGLLGAGHRSAIGLEQLLEDFLDVPVEIEQFVGGWHGISEDSQCRLEDPFEGEIGLGEGLAVGDEIWDPQARVRVRVGPLSRERYADFLPGGSGYDDIVTIARLYSDDHFEFELRPVLQAEDVPGMVLGESEDTPLSWCSWLHDPRTPEGGARPLGRDADETTLELVWREDS